MQDTVHFLFSALLDLRYMCNEYVLLLILQVQH